MHKVIDFHNHALPPEVMGLAGPYGPEEIAADTTSRTIVAAGQTHVLSPRPLDKPYFHQYLDRAEAAGVDMCGIEVTPIWNFYWAEAEIIVPFVQKINDTLSGYVHKNPEKLFFLAGLPLQDMPKALVEADRAVKELGAKAFFVGTNDINGYYLDDEYFDPLYAKAVDLDVPIFVHPGPDKPNPDDPDKYRFHWIPGFEFKETIAVNHLIYGGVLDRFPQLKVIVSHGGGTIPYLIGKVSRLLDGGKASPTDVKAKKEYEYYLKNNFYFDTFVEDDRVLKLLYELMGPERMLFAQHTGMANTGGKELDRIRRMDIPDSEKEMILSGNATKLFKL